MIEVITPGGAPTPPTPQGANKPTESAAANSGTVSMDDALKGAEHAKMNVFSVSDVTKGSPGSAAGAAPVGTGTSVALGGLVQGKVAVELMDSLVPKLLVLLFHRANIVVKATQFGLTAGEKNTLAPIVDACLNTLMMDFSNPWTALVASLAIIYGGKAAEVGGVAWMDKKTETTPFVPPAKAPAKSTLSVVRPESVDPAPASKDTGSFEDGNKFGGAGPSTWTDADVRAVAKRRKKGFTDAQQWLEKNWLNNGGRV